MTLERRVDVDRLRDVLATQGLGVAAHDVLRLMRHMLGVHINGYHGRRLSDEQVARLEAKVDGVLASLREREVWP